MKKKETASIVTGVIMLLFSVLLLVGIETFFAPCGPKEDGSFMACHWMGKSVMGAACILCVISLLHLILPKDIKLGLGIAAIPTALIAVLLPNVIMGTCMMESMQCNSLSKPAVTVIGLVILIAAAVDVIILAADRKKSAVKEKSGDDK